MKGIILHLFCPVRKRDVSSPINLQGLRTACRGNYLGLSATGWGISGGAWEAGLPPQCWDIPGNREHGSWVWWGRDLGRVQCHWVHPSTRTDLGFLEITCNNGKSPSATWILVTLLGGKAMPYSPSSEAAISSRGTDLHSLRISCHSGSTLGPILRLVTLEQPPFIPATVLWASTLFWSFQRSLCYSSFGGNVASSTSFVLSCSDWKVVQLTDCGEEPGCLPFSQEHIKCPQSQSRHYSENGGFSYYTLQAETFLVSLGFSVTFFKNPPCMYNF